MLIFLPALVYIVTVHFKDPMQIPVVITGVLSSVIFCILKAFFSYMHRVAPAGFVWNFIYILFARILLPVIIVYLLFLHFSNDDRQFKARSFFPLLGSFYTVFLPYCIIAGNGSAFSFFELFLEPVMYGLMLLSAAECVQMIYDNGWRFLSTAGLVLALVTPAAVQTCWFTGMSFAIWLSLYIVYTGTALFGCFSDIKTHNGYLFG